MMKYAVRSTWQSLLVLCVVGMANMVSNKVFAQAIPAAQPIAKAPVRFTLRELFELASRNDLQYQAARANAETLYEQYLQAIGSMLPNINASASLTNTSTDKTPDVGSASSSKADGVKSFTLSLTQPIFRWQSIKLLQIGSKSKVLADIQRQQARADLILRLTQAYFDVALAQESLEFVRIKRQAIAEQLAVAKRNFEIGSATITDQQDAQARYDLSYAEELQASNDLTNKLASLSLMVQTSVDAVPRVQALVLPALQPNDEAAWLQQAKDGNLIFLQRQLELEAASLATSQAVGGHLPSLDLTASLNRQVDPYQSASGTNYAGNIDTTTIALTLTVPIFAGGATQSKVREATARQDAALAAAELARRQAETAVHSNFLGYASGLAQVSALEAAEKSSQLSLDSNKLGYDVGVRINNDVLNAQQQFFQTRRDLNKARFDTLLTGLRLKQTVGGLRDDEILNIAHLMGDKP